MGTATETAAAEQGRLWSARAADWAAQEEMEPERFAPVADLVRAGEAVLEVGCGSGVFLGLAAARGARVTGVDAAAALVAVARERVPEADVRVGDAEALPFPDDAFDLVAGFNVFFFASDMVAALREAGRVARPGARVIAGVWGRPEACDVLTVVGAVRALGGPRPGGGPSLAAPGVLEGIAAQAGLTPDAPFDRTLALRYPDLDTFVRRMMSAGPMVAEAEAHGAAAVADAIRAAGAGFRAADGSVRLVNEWHYAVARAA
jgi:SAM-dependent methyltransferase